MDEQSKQRPENSGTEVKDNKNDNAKKGLLAVVLVLLLALAGVGVWGMQQNEARDPGFELSTEPQQSKDAVEQSEEVSEEEAEELAAAEPVESVEGLATGQTRPHGLDVIVDVLVDSDRIQLSEVWVEYGTSYEKLNQETKPTSGGLGYNTDGYGSFGQQIADSELKNGQTYFYRAAGKTTDGDVVYGGTAAFSAPK